MQGAGAGLAGGLLALVSFGTIVRMLTGQGLPAHLIWQTLLIWPALTGAIALVSGQVALWGSGGARPAHAARAVTRRCAKTPDVPLRTYGVRGVRGGALTPPPPRRG